MPTPPRSSNARPAPRPRGANRPAGQRPATRQVRRSRTTLGPTFAERNRGRLVWATILIAILALGGLAYVSFTTPAYACSVEWVADPTPTPAPSATQRLGNVQEDMGRTHVATGTRVKYRYCPPASGNHYSATGQGPLQPKVYGPNDKAIPEGWIHNLEHGGLVLVYNCGAPPKGGDGCTDAKQAAMKALYQSWPLSPVCQLQPGVVGPVIARFDDMAYPYAALLWDEVLPLQTLDTDQIKAFFLQQAERTNPEQQPGCAAASSAPSTAPSPGASPTTVPSQAPASAAPTTSPAPAASSGGSGSLPRAIARASSSAASKRPAARARASPPSKPGTRRTVSPASSRTPARGSSSR